MGTPACRITDPTAHGGVIVVGAPTVLIGMLPAARIGDMHTCPMVTPGVPPIPHVGGPFVMGAPTVLVVEMPQSRVGDELVCVGPPDVAIMGEPTVLVGMAGAGGMVAAVTGVQAVGVPVPLAPPCAPTLTATLQSDGTIATAAPPGGSLPPIPLSHRGWPDLPPDQTAAFQSVQPVTLPAGTQLFAPSPTDPAALSLWSTTPPAPGVSCATLTVDNPDGLRAWAGAAASGLSVTQVCIPKANAPRGRVLGVSGTTVHGFQGAAERKFSPEDVKEAVASAIQSGQVEAKVGKYGSPQRVYRGTNDLTVVQETEGRNAGKIMTGWWRQP